MTDHNPTPISQLPSGGNDCNELFAENEHLRRQLGAILWGDAIKPKYKRMVGRWVYQHQSSMAREVDRLRHRLEVVRKLMP